MGQGIVEVPIKCTGIAVVLLKKSGTQHKVLLLRRASSVLHGAWCYIGGGIETGEKAWEAALREIAEETGITQVSLYNSNKFDQFYSSDQDYIYVAPVFVGYVDEEQQVRINEEHSDYQWFTFREALEKVAVPGNDDVLVFVEKHFAKRSPADWQRVHIK